MSMETRRVISQQESHLSGMRIQIWVQNIQGEMQWTTVDGVYLSRTLDVIHVENNGRVSGMRPTTQDSIKNLEKITIDGTQESSSMPVCSICLEMLSIGSKAIRMPKPCSHLYHQDCIIRWLNRSNTCPLCRRSI